MTTPEENVTADEKDEIVATPATPGADGLPLDDEATPDPAEG